MKTKLIPTVSLAVAAVGLLMCARLAIGDGQAATEPTDPDLIRLDFLGDRLTSDEASIAAINKALVATGYKAAAAAEQLDAAQSTHRQLDFNGGGPVRWRDFYGTTAKDFIGVHRPDEVFNYVYRGQDDTISVAQQQVAAIGEKVDALLTERRKRETEQSSLWATLAFTAIQNRDISTRPLYRYQLVDTKSKADDNAPAKDPRIDFLRAAVLYMRTLDHTVAVLSDKLETDQYVAYQGLRDTLKGVQTNVETSGNDLAEGGPGTTPADAATIMEIVNQTKAIKEYCQNICEAYPKAMERDAAGDEAEKLHLRGLVQQSLLGLASAGVKIDNSTVKAAAGWQITAEKGTLNSDAIPDVVLPAANAEGKGADGTAAANAPEAAPAAVSPATPPGEQTGSAQDDPPGDHRRVNLLAMVDPGRDGVEGIWRVNDGALEGQPSPRARIEFPYAPGKEYDFRVVFTRVAGNQPVDLICIGEDHRFVWMLGGGKNKTAGFLTVGRRSANYIKRADSWIANGQTYTTTVKVREGRVQTFLNGALVIDARTDFSDLTVVPGSELHHKNALGVLFINSRVKVSSAEVVEVSGEGESLR
jgi:hypothetical protein